VAQLREEVLSSKWVEQMLRLGEQQTPEGLSCVGFNQDGTCIASSGKGKVKIYNCEDHATCFELNIHRVQ